ncbi:uncharacterized protein LOC142765568 [Rhipicephalus microplus]|uniref:uncharacterized protein LOC142765568 n=1 Tax=Rhipicephalus microplus TaxID=6941 RepID=UPI003F6D6863
MAAAQQKAAAAQEGVLQAVRSLARAVVEGILRERVIYVRGLVRFHRDIRELAENLIGRIDALKSQLRNNRPLNQEYLQDMRNLYQMFFGHTISCSDAARLAQHAYWRARAERLRNACDRAEGEFFLLNLSRAMGTPQHQLDTTIFNNYLSEIATLMLAPHPDDYVHLV